MDFLLLGIAIAIIILLLMTAQKFLSKKDKKIKSSVSSNSSNNTSGTSTGSASFMNCPLCSSNLKSGENLLSKVYRPMNVPDQRCTISGCPHCFPKCESGIKRVCPVCKKTVPSNGYLVARLFNKSSGKKHVMIVGCTECLKGYSKNS